MAIQEHAPAPVDTPFGARHARRGTILLLIAAFNVWLWVTRAINLFQDPEPRTTGFIVVHAILYGVSFGLAFVLAGMGWNMHREAKG